MTIQVLVATMHQTDHSLLEKMNIRTDAIIGNQCDRNEVEDFEWNGHRIKYLSFAERGVGLNRNNTLMRADADVCLFADDDVVYYDDYAEKIEKAFTDIAIPTKSIGKLKGLMDNTPDITDTMVANFEKIVKDEKSYNKAISTINEIKLAYLGEILGPEKVSEYG